MKYWLLLASLMLTACTTMPTPTVYTGEVWQEYGKERALNGLNKQSESKLMKLDKDMGFNTELYRSYLTGYKEGQDMYCQQNAYMLGVVGQPYSGICDELNPFFSQDYASGRHSTAGNVFR